MPSPVHHFMRDDLVGALLGAILYTLFLVAPGYAIAWLANLRDFRRESQLWRILWAIPLSVGIMPIFAFLAASALGMKPVWALYAAASLGMLATLRTPGRQKWPRWLVAAGAIWALVAILSGIDLQLGERLYPSVLVYDFNVRSAIIDSISRHGLPAVNPLFHPGHDVPLRYHYFWFIPASLVEQLGGAWVSPRQALVAGNVWCGYSLMAIVLLFLRYLRPSGGDPLGRRGLWAVGMLAAAGLDIVPNAEMAITYWTSGGSAVMPSAEWWNNPLTGFPHAALWVAHHVSAVIACLAGFLLLWRTRQRMAIVLAGACFASAAGLSIYVAFAFAITMAVWMGWQALRKHWSTAIESAAAGTVAAVLAAPYLLSMLTGPAGGGGSFISPTVRTFTPLEGTLVAFGWNWNAIAAANLLFLPLNFLFEAALLTCLAWLWIQRRRRLGVHTDETRALIVLIAVPMLVATFLRSGVISNNDLGWRAPLLAQCVLTIACVDLMRAAIVKPKRRMLAVVMGVCILSSVWDLGMMRSFPLLTDKGKAQPAPWLFGGDVGMRFYNMRALYEDLDRQLPRTAIVQANPNVWNQVFLGAYSKRQTSSFDIDCGAVMGGDPADCARLQPVIARPFVNAVSEDSIDHACAAAGADALIFERTDAQPAVPSSRILAANAWGKAVSCRRNSEVARTR